MGVRINVHPSIKNLINRSRFRMLCELGGGLMRGTHRSHEIQTTSGMLLTTSAVHVFRILYGRFVCQPSQ
ncbi:hypothetical protein ALP79_200262 [Pseudomonas savastanoi pv. fraxini]|nr:hypothetical protein ALP79_200262 [Pseudomonas savastanoi pv. fraxini]